MYMSPEQIDRSPEISFRSDIYSLGAVLYEVLTGVTPFQGKIIRVLLDQIRSQFPEDPKSVDGSLANDFLADLTMRCLRKNPENRPESADEIVRALKENVVP